MIVFGLCHYYVQSALCPFFVFVTHGASSQFSVFPCVSRSPEPWFHHSITVILSWLPVCTHRMICSTCQCHWMFILLYTAYCLFSSYGGSTTLYAEFWSSEPIPSIFFYILDTGLPIWHFWLLYIFSNSILPAYLLSSYWPSWNGFPGVYCLDQSCFLHIVS